MSEELCSTMLRPAPTGQDSSESDFASVSEAGIVKDDDLKSSVAQLTPRRFTSRDLQENRDRLCTDEDKLAPLGFEPEGRAVSSPTYCERWANSFTDLLNDSDGSNLFYKYLRREGASILLDFSRECEAYRRMVPTSTQMRTTAKTLFQKFVYPRQFCELLGVKDTTRTQIAHHVNDQPADPALFDGAYAEVVSYMKKCHYVGFVNSNLYKDFTQAHRDTETLTLGERTPQYPGRYHSGYLPTLPEEKVLGFGEEIEEEQFELDQSCKDAIRYPYIRSAHDEQDARKLLHAPMKDIISQYYYPSVPLASRTESENQSLSSDALTDDTLSTLSMTTTEGGMTDTSDGLSIPRNSRRRRGAAHKSRNGGPLPHFPFVPRSHRMPKEAKNPLQPEEFAKILISKLEKVKLERELMEREASNLSGICESEYGQSKKSILQEAIENKQRQGKIPLCTMAMSALPPMQDDASSLSASNHGSSSSKSTNAQVTAGSTVRDSSSSGSTHRRSRHSHHSTKTPKQEQECADKDSDLASAQGKDPSRSNTKPANTARPDDCIPFLTLNHQRILQWMEMGEEELRQQKTQKVRHQSPSSSSSRGSSKSRQSSSTKGSEHYSNHKPSQPIAQDPLMPPLPQPEATTVLGEVARRLVATKEMDKKSRHHHHKHRSKTSVDDISDSVSSCQEKIGSSTCSCSATDCSSCAQSMLSYDINHPAPSYIASSTLSSIPSSASNYPSDTKSKSDSGISGTTRKKEKHNATTIIYWLWGEPIAYRTSLPGKHITLGQFKTLIMRKGEFRYFFKTKTEDRECEVVYEEVKEDKMMLPTFEGKIVGKVEKVDS
ncbi:predicted protein [Nematostella vectensis]|uniref:Axin n=1 Tax=Nematostella vectensis TaxID=45351 RepID=A7RUI9_NEMVE|nr:predicted protein [Nematostella vectensis]|eukprot:XP_001636924.1 predicted protein [Nematostella vectensis]